jgi:protein-disulfide isomerase
VTVVEFGDLTCASCRHYYPLVRSTLARYPVTVRFVYRNMPMLMPRHENAFNAAVLAEIAAERGRFYDYLRRAHGLPGEPPAMDAFVRAARDCGADVTGWRTRALDAKDAAFQRVYVDMEQARRLRIGSAPTYFLCMPGSAPSPQDGRGIWEILQDPSFLRTLDRLRPPH